MKIDIKALLKDAIKELPDDAAREQVLAYIDAAIAKAEAIEGAPKSDEMPPEEMATPPEMPPPDAAMSAVPATSAAAPPVAAADPPPPAPPAVAVDAEAAAVIGLVAQALGKDPVEVLALMRDQAQAVAALLAGTPPSGMPAESSALSLSLQVANRRAAALEKTTADQATMIADLTSKVDAARVEGLGREIDESIRLGHFLPGDKPLLLSLAKSDERALREHLSNAKATPRLPTGRVSTPGDAAVERDVGEANEVAHEEHQLRLSLKGAGWTDAKIDAHMKARAKKTNLTGRA